VHINNLRYIFLHRGCARCIAEGNVATQRTTMTTTKPVLQYAALLSPALQNLCHFRLNFVPTQEPKIAYIGKMAPSVHVVAKFVIRSALR
jgi:hypothetical protein